MNAPTVFHVDCDTGGYRSAVATIISDIKKATNATLLDIAESIDASRDTISDAEAGKTTLNPVHLARLGQKYGGAFLNPFFALFGAQAAPMDKRRTRDIHPIVARVSHKLALASDPDGPGGSTHVPQERAAYLPDLKELNRETACTIAEIESVLA